MYKKLFNPFIFLFSLSLIISACKKDEPHFFELDETTLSFEIEGGSQNIAILSNGNWTISNTANWLTVSPLSGNGNTTVTVIASENETFEKRETTLTFSSEIKTITVEITQRAKEFYLELDKTTLVFEADSESQNIKVLSNGTWIISNKADWITISPQSGDGNATIIVTTLKNKLPKGREITLTFSGETKIATIEITQKAYGVVINGVRWATRNVASHGTFVDSLENYGAFFLRGGAGNNSINDWNAGTELTPIKTANDPCPQGWRVPTWTELQTLRTIPSRWTAVNSINGRQFGRAPNTIFLPAAGSLHNFQGIQTLVLTVSIGVVLQQIVSLLFSKSLPI